MYDESMILDFNVQFNCKRWLCKYVSSFYFLTLPKTGSIAAANIWRFAAANLVRTLLLASNNTALPVTWSRTRFWSLIRQQRVNLISDRRGLLVMSGPHAKLWSACCDAVTRNWANATLYPERVVECVYWVHENPSVWPFCGCLMAV